MHHIYNIKKIAYVLYLLSYNNTAIYEVNTFQGDMLFRNWGGNRGHIGINSRKLESCIEYKCDYFYVGCIIISWLAHTIDFEC